jgi:hypothetical protein
VTTSATRRSRSSDPSRRGSSKSCRRSQSRSSAGVASALAAGTRSARFRSRRRTAPARLSAMKQDAGPLRSPYVAATGGLGGHPHRACSDRAGQRARPSVISVTAAIRRRLRRFPFGAHFCHRENEHDFPIRAPLSTSWPSPWARPGLVVAELAPSRPLSGRDRVGGLPRCDRMRSQLPPRQLLDWTTRIQRHSCRLRGPCTPRRSA